MKRREFLRTLGLMAAGCQSSPRRGAIIQTVLGPIPANGFGSALTHEHVICDFIGAEKTGRHRWNVDEVVSTMRPYLETLKRAGVSGFVDCTPPYIGRDPRVLERLARDTRLHIVTNTGYYGGANDKYVPKHAYDETEEQLANRWIAEWRHGIEDTGVKPGFIKIGVDEVKDGQLSQIDTKLLRSAALASRETNLAVVCHTGGGAAGLAAARLFSAPKRKFIVAHSDGHGLEINKQVADLGAWVSFDAISRKPVETHVKLVKAMLENHSDRLLLSQDNGWYAVGEPQKIRSFTQLSELFLPALKKTGVTDEIVQKLLVSNPAAAFAI